MVSSLKLPINIIDKTVGILLDSGTEITTFRINVPKLMPNTAVGTASTHIACYASTTTIFANDPACKPVVKNIIKGQNYITARMEGSTEKVSDYLNGDITIKTFKAGKKVACFSPSGKLSNLIFTTGSYI